MPKAKLSVSVPEEAWMHEISTAHSETGFRVVALTSDGERGVVLLELSSQNPVPVITDIERREDVLDLELLWKRSATTMLQVETTNPSLLGAAMQAGTPLRTPFEVSDAVATWEITASTNRLSALATRLDEAGITFDTEYVHEEPNDPNGPTDRLLTSRQRDVLLAAAEQGYYDTPRSATLTEVAESLEVSKATVSDILHRAEGKLLKWIIDEHLTDGG